MKLTHHNKIFLGFFVFFFALSLFSFITVRSLERAGVMTGDALLAQNKLLPEECDEPSEAAKGSVSCGAVAFLQLLGNVITFLLELTFWVAPLLIAWGGIVILTAGGSPQKISSGKQIILSAVVGVIIALAAFLIIRLLFMALGVDQGLFGGLFN